MKGLRLVFVFVVSIGMAASARASLTTDGYLTGSSGRLIKDTSTGLIWLVPSYTQNHTYDDSFVQNIISTYGYAYATEAQVESMIASNFNTPPTSSPGSLAGYADVQAFFNIFGVNEADTCTGGPCPRTQGLTSTSSQAGNHDAVGMIYSESYNGQPLGYEIVNNSWPQSFADPQMGSWLVYNSAAQPAVTPEPSSLLLLGTGMASLTALMCKRNRRGL